MSKGSKIQDLESDIKSYDRSLKRKPNEGNTHYLKGKALYELGNLTGESLYYQKALASFSTAIELEPENAMYAVERSKLHAAMGNTKQAAEDVVRAKSAPNMEGVQGMYTNFTAKHILQLDGVQDEVKRLISNGDIPAGLEKVFGDIIHVINDISIAVAKHDERLDGVDAKMGEHDIQLALLRKQNAELQKLLKDYPQTIKIIEKLEKEVENLTERVQKVEYAVEQCASKDELKTIAKKMKKIDEEYKLFDGKLEVIEGELGDQKKSLVAFDDVLRKSNFFSKESIKKDFDDLAKDTPELYSYANSFYWTLSNYLLAYRAINTGAVQGIRDKNKLEKVWDKVGGVVVNLTGYIPVVGSALAMVEEGIAYINEAYKEMKFDRKVAKVNELMTSYILEEDLSLAVASAALKIVTIKNQEILQKYQEASGSLKSANQGRLQEVKDSIRKKANALDEKIDKFCEKVTGVKSTKDVLATKLAMKDVVLFLNYIATHEIKLVTEDTAKSLDKVISETFKEHIADSDKAIIEALNEKEQAAKGDCIVAMVNGITYDNILLNYPELLSEAAKLFGIDRALDLSELLPPELTSEAIASHDATLVLAGMMSVNDNFGA